MRQLDEKERKLVKELIKNPRLSDNQISKQTRIPVMTVNRKRKNLEKEGILHYFTYLDNSRYGTKSSSARQLYTLTLTIGITKKEFIEKLLSDPSTKGENTTYIYESFIGEENGRLVWVFIIEGSKDREIVEVFNGKIVPMIRKNFGENAIEETNAIRLTTQFRLFHNYMPLINMENGKLKKDYPNELIFVDQ